MEVKYIDSRISKRSDRSFKLEKMELKFCFSRNFDKMKNKIIKSKIITERIELMFGDIKDYTLLLFLNGSQKKSKYKKEIKKLI